MRVPLSFGLLVWIAACASPVAPPGAGDLPRDDAAGAVLSGFVRGLSGEAVEATLHVAGWTGATGPGGVFRAGPLPTGDVLLNVQAEGYASSYTRLSLRDGDQTTSILLLRAAPLTLPAAPPVSVETSDGVRIRFVSGTFRYRDDSSDASFPIDGSVALLDTPEELAAAPGGLVAQDGGALIDLESYGMVDVALSKGGRAVRFEGEAELSFPLASTASLPDGDRPPLWHFDEVGGVWLRDGEGVVEAGRFVATVTHFSWWNADRPKGESSCLSGSLHDPSISPLPGFIVRATGLDHLGASTAATGADGAFCIPVRKDSRVRLQADGVAAGSAFSMTFDADTPPSGACGVSCLDVGMLVASDLNSDDDADGLDEFEGDCDDLDAAIRPGRPDLTMDGVDQDCDGVDGPDADGDGVVAASGGGLDCDDLDAAVHPGAPETCDGRDEDCDGIADETPSEGGFAFARDSDLDGWGDAADLLVACSASPGRTGQVGDCDDGDAAVHPGAAETCDGVDEDCDGTADEAPASGAPLWFVDLDGDGYGSGSGTASCLAPPLAVSQGGDCDDGTSAVSPVGIESCNGRDDDCDGVVDEGGAGSIALWLDVDGDGFGGLALLPSCFAGPGQSAVGGDCDDGDAFVYPGAAEDCASLEDRNCDGSVAYEDWDGDGAAACFDCDDLAAAVYPGAPESCDEVDSDCDGSAVDFYADTDLDGVPDCVDADDDGDLDPDTTDCAPLDPTRGAASLESCDAIDSDCDGSWVDGYPDLDGDGSPDCVDVDDDGDGVADAVDCAPDDAAVYPGAEETCDGADTDCDGSVDPCGLGAGPALVGTMMGEALGTAFATGDIDADGVVDVLVGAPGWWGAGALGQGASFVVSGADFPSLDIAAASMSAGIGGDDHAGGAVAACDLNGDGDTDLAVGAWASDGSGAASGGVFVQFGPIVQSRPLADADVRYDGQSAGDWAGYALACADVTGDWEPDLLVSAHRDDDAGIDAGAVYLLASPLQPGTRTLQSADGKLVGQSPFDFAGRAVAAGDIDGDGVGDVVVGAPGRDEGGSGAGAVYVSYGPVGGFASLASASRFVGAAAGDEAGAAVAVDVDADGDGARGVLIGAPGADAETGAVWPVVPAAGVVSLQGAACWSGIAPGDALGTAIATGGDVDGDGLPDRLLGASGAFGTGGAWLISGASAPGPLASALASYAGEGPGDALGAALAVLPDLDGDGRDEVVLGAPLYDGFTGALGAVYYVLGGGLP